MWGSLTTVLAALIGAAIGSLGAVWLEARLTRESEESRQRELLKKRYFFQLQDAAQSLWFRLDNLAHRRGRSAMEDDYFATTTLYALGRVFAIERILAAEGIYPELERLYPGLGDFLMTNSLNRNFRAAYEYHRLALAEAVMERDDEGFRVSTFVEFRERYKSSTDEERTWLEPALNGIKQIDLLTIQSAMASLKEVALRISKETGTASPLEKPGSRL